MRSLQRLENEEKNMNQACKRELAMEHDKVRDLLMDCRADIAVAANEIEALTARVRELEEREAELLKRIATLEKFASPTWT